MLSKMSLIRITVGFTCLFSADGACRPVAGCPSILSVKTFRAGKTAEGTTGQSILEIA
jgi:hypothetical protein